MKKDKAKPITKKDQQKILKLIRKSEYGLSITELTEKSEFPRCKVRTCLARLEGADKIKFRSIGMAKIYIPKFSY